MEKTMENTRLYLVTAHMAERSLGNYLTEDLEDAFRYIRENVRLGWHCELKEM